MKIIHSATYDFKLKYEIKQASPSSKLSLAGRNLFGKTMFWCQQVRDFIDDIGDKNYSFYFSTNNKESIYRSIEYRTSQYRNWTSSNVQDLSKWLKKRLNIKER